MLPGADTVVTLKARGLTPAMPKSAMRFRDGVLGDPFAAFEEIERDARGAVGAVARSVEAEDLRLQVGGGASSLGSGALVWVSRQR